MRNKAIIWIMIAVISVVFVSLTVYLLEPAQQKDSLEVIKEDEATNAASRDEIPEAVFEDEPEARALYDKMIETMRQAESLSYTSEFSREKKGRKIDPSTYTILMKKPNYFRVDTINSKGVEGGTLIGDGDYLWIYWPGNRPFFSKEDRASYEKSKTNVYMKEATPLGKHSIGHKDHLLGAGIGMIIDPSTFHGYTDTLVPYIDWVRGMGKEKVGDEECDVIEVSFMKHQRSWYLWLSRRDNLPRKLKEIVRAANNIIVHEEWSQVTINAEIPVEKFAWAPPEGWQQWSLPGPEEYLIKPGQEAPDFELLTADGGKVKLSDYRGKVVWFYIWRAGCPVCREEMCHLQELHEKYKDKGMVILGFNCSDDKRIAMEFLKENSATFTNILDSSDAATRTGFEGYRMSGVPLNYIIDKEGKVVDAWYGYEKGHKRALDALRKAGLDLEGQ